MQTNYLTLSMFIFLWVAVAFRPNSFAMAPARPFEAQVESPNGQVSIRFILQKGGRPAYEITYLGKSIVLPSRLGFLPAFDEGFSLSGNFKTREH